MKDNKSKFINSRVGRKHKILLQEILDKSDMSQSEFLRFAIEEGYKSWIMNNTIAKHHPLQNLVSPI